MRMSLQSALFYEYDRMLASTDPECLHTAFDTPTGISYWMELKKNVRKTEVIVCHSFREARVRADKSYTRRETGAGRSYKERKREWVS